MRLYYPNRIEDVRGRPEGCISYEITRAEEYSQGYIPKSLTINLGNGRTTRIITLAKSVIKQFLRDMGSFKPRDLVGKTISGIEGQGLNLTALCI